MDKLVKIVHILGKVLEAANMIHSALHGIITNFKPLTTPTAPAPAPVDTAPAEGL